MNFTPKRAGEVEVFTIDFSALLQPNEFILTNSWSISAVLGIDSNASAMPQGPATISGSKVSQMIGGGIAGVFYAPLCTITTSLSQTFVLPEPGAGLLLIE